LGVLTPGLRREGEMVVTAADSAAAQTAIVPDVLASARMIYFMECVCAELMLEHLAPGEMSVGIDFHLTHEAPTPIGMRIFASVEIVEVSGRKVVFEAVARDEVEVIGRGRHGRAIIDTERFMKRVNGKRAPR
jgi:predicted thioesterase